MLAHKLRQCETTFSTGIDVNAAQIIKDAAEHIEAICPRPGPSHPAFAALLAFAYKAGLA